MNFNERETKQSSIKQSIKPVQQPSKRSGFNHPTKQSTAASSKQCKHVRCSFIWIFSLPPFWLVYLSCFPFQVWFGQFHRFLPCWSQGDACRSAASRKSYADDSGIIRDVEWYWWDILGICQKYEKVIITLRNKYRENMGTLWESASNVAVIPSHWD